MFAKQKYVSEGVVLDHDDVYSSGIRDHKDHQVVSYDSIHLRLSAACG